jgi:hypothetical protein
MLLLFLASTLLLLINSIQAVDYSHPNVTITKIAFGSCHKNKVAASPPIWDRIRQEQPDAWLWTGDAVYKSRNKETTTWKEKYGPGQVSALEKEYHQLLTNATIGYSSFQPPLGIYGTWDDHDYGGNDMGNDLSQKQERKAAFFDFLGIAPPSPAREGVYTSVEWGESPRKVKAILLDTRWFREGHCIPSMAHVLPLGTAVACTTRFLTASLRLDKLIKWIFGKDCASSQLLGEDQWNWLEQELESSDAQIHIIASSIQVLTTNPVFESWGHFPNEKRRLVQLMDKYSSQKGPIVLLSGDVHHAELSGLRSPSFVEEEQNPSPLLQESRKASVARRAANNNNWMEVTSSGLTHDCSQPKLYGKACQPILQAYTAHRLFEDSVFIGRNYGVLRVDWNDDYGDFSSSSSGMKPLLIVQVKSITGETVLETTLPLVGSSSASTKDDADDADNNATLAFSSSWDQLPSTWDGHLIIWVERLLFTVTVMITLARSVHWRGRGPQP